MNEKELEITATLAETIPGLDEAAREFLLGMSAGMGVRESASSPKSGRRRAEVQAM